MLNARDAIRSVNHLRIAALQYRDLHTQLPELGTLMIRLAEDAERLAAMLEAGYVLEFTKPNPTTQRPSALDFAVAQKLTRALAKATPEILQSCQDFADELLKSPIERMRRFDV